MTLIPGQMEQIVNRSLSIIRDLVDDNPCWYDHHGNCQEHGWTTDNNSVCPQKRAQELLAEIDEKKKEPVFINFRNRDDIWGD